MLKVSLLALFFSFFVIHVPRVEATIRHYEWEVKYENNSLPTTGPLWNDTTSQLPQSPALKAREGFINTPPRTADGVIMLLNAQNKIDGSSRLPTTSCVLAPKEKTNAFDQNQTPYPYNFVNYCIYNFTKNGNFTTGNCTCEIKSNTVVDLILQNAMTGNVTTHSLHFHGHDVWVLKRGIGDYNISEDWKNYNLDNPIMKNTVHLHSGEWIALRFRVDSAGVLAISLSLIPV